MRGGDPGGLCGALLSSACRERLDRHLRRHVAAVIGQAEVGPAQTNPSM
jgi:hypothetical protein